MNGWKRYLSLTLSLVLLLGLLSLGSLAAKSGTPEVAVRVESDPAGADIYLDGALYRPAVTPCSVPVEPGDKILLCSDGLYDEVDDETILSTLNRYEDMTVCAEDLVYMANESGGNDNISVICIDLED